jgi:shikimate kinase
MSASPRIIILGFMCAGKTTVAKALAGRLGCRMIDLDYIIAEMEKRSAGSIIDEEGETKFRETETRALRVVLENNTARVIALGGGAWTLAQNRALISEHAALTVWLDAPFELCWQRITNDAETRPLARDAESARQLFDARLALYALADLRVEVRENKSAEEIAEEIMVALA